MKVSLGKFYREVTGANTGNTLTIIPALKRWGIPFDADQKVSDRVEIRYLDAAREAYRKEEEAKEARKHARTSLKKAGNNEKQAELPLDTRLSTSPLRGIHEKLEVQGQALGRIEEMLAHIHKDLYEKRTR